MSPLRPDSLSSWAKAAPQRMWRHAAPQRRAFNLEPWVYVGERERRGFLWMEKIQSAFMVWLIFLCGLVPGGFAFLSFLFIGTVGLQCVSAWHFCVTTTRSRVGSIGRQFDT